MPSVFISYSSKDASEARRLARELARNGISAWIDEYEILPGDSIGEKITEGLRTSEYLLVLLSKNSTQSDWVRFEIGKALDRNREATAIRIIPVRLDDSPVPDDLRDVRYINLYSDYQRGLNELYQAILRRQSELIPKVSDLFKSEELVEHIQSQQKEFKGSGYLITTILGILTLLVSIIAAIPGFYSAFGDRSHVVYSISEHQISVPFEIDKEKIKKLLRENDIPDITQRIEIINTGEAVARQVKVGVTANGKIIYAKSEPPAEPEPVWVKIKIERGKEETPSYVRYSFMDLVPTKRVSALVGYSNSNDSLSSTIDVIYDGKPAEQVSSIDNVPQWSYWKAFETPLRILGLGLLLTVLIGFVVVIKNNPRLRDALLLIMKELNPTISKIVDVILKTTR